MVAPVAFRLGKSGITGFVKEDAIRRNQVQGFCYLSKAAREDARIVANFSLLHGIFKSEMGGFVIGENARRGERPCHRNKTHVLP
jgi:hypothetical protein